MLTVEASRSRPRYQEIANELINNIREGRFAIGTLMPGELELMETYDVSRHTVREALRMLESLHLIERKRGIGTLVLASKSEHAYVQSVRNPSELLCYPTESKLRILSTTKIRVNKSQAKIFKCRARSDWTLIRGIRTFAGSDLPICALSVLVLPEYSGVAEKLSSIKKPVFQAIADTYGESIQKVSVDFSSSLIDEALSKLLGIEIGTAVLRVRRQYVGNSGKIFEISVTDHVESNFNFSFEFSRGWETNPDWAED